MPQNMSKIDRKDFPLAMLLLEWTRHSELHFDNGCLRMRISDVSPRSDFCQILNKAWRQKRSPQVLELLY